MVEVPVPFRVIWFRKFCWSAEGRTRCRKTDRADRLVERIEQVNLRNTGRTGRIGIGHGGRLSDGVDGHSLKSRGNLNGLIGRAIEN